MPDDEKLFSSWEFCEPDTLHEMGWTVPAGRFPHVLLDSSSTPPWCVTRMWSSPSTFRAAPRGPAVMRAIIGVDGVARITAPTGSMVLAPGQVVVFDGGTPIETSNTTPWARFVWEVDSGLHRNQLSRAVGRPISLANGYWQLLAAATNSLASQNNREEDAAPGALFLADALASVLAAATAAESDPQVDALSDERFALYRNAIQTIDERHRDPEFTVGALARHLAVSVQHLHRVFALAGTTPGREIEQRRSMTAQVLLSSARAPRAETLRAIATQSGFTSTWRMRAAQRRQQGTATGAP